MTIHRLDLLAWNAPDAKLDIECSKGTYVRAIAADLGEALGCGAHLVALRRTGSGGFDIANAMTLDALELLSEAERDRRLLPTRVLVAHMPALAVESEAAQRFLHGGAIPAQGCSPGSAAVFEGDSLLGVAEVVDAFAHPRRVLPGAPDSGEQSA